MYKKTLLSFLFIIILLGGGCNKAPEGQNQNNEATNEKETAVDADMEREENKEDETRDEKEKSDNKTDVVLDLKQADLDTLKNELESLQYEDIQSLNN